MAARLRQQAATFAAPCSTCCRPHLASPVGRSTRRKQSHAPRATSTPKPHGGAEPPPQPSPLRSQPGVIADFVPSVIRDYDEQVQYAKQVVDDAAEALKAIDDEIAEVTKSISLPGFMQAYLRWGRRYSNESLESAQQRHARLVARRELVVAALRTLEADMAANPPLYAPDDTSASWVALAACKWAVQQEHGDSSPEELQKVMRDALEQTNSPRSVLWAAVVACSGISLALSWAGGWWGVDAYRLLHEAPDFSAVAPAWLAWTAPYVLCTLAAYPLAPQLFTKSILRAVATDQRNFFHDVPPATFVPAAFVVAYAQCLVYQGLWQDVITGWLGGSRDALLLTDPAALEGSVRQSLGTLVGAPRLPAFLVAPSAAMLTGLLEGAYFWTANAVRDSGASLTIAAEEEEGAPVSVLSANWAPGALSEEELPLVATRIALSGSYLALEATLTGSLWLAVGTSAAGILTCILLSRGARKAAA